MIYLFFGILFPLPSLFFFLPPLCSVLYPVNAFFCAAFFLSLSLSPPLLLFSEWLLFHVGCPCWKNQSNVVFTLKSHCFHDYKKKATFSCVRVFQYHRVSVAFLSLSDSRKLLPVGFSQVECWEHFRADILEKYSMIVNDSSFRRC